MLIGAYITVLQVRRFVFYNKFMTVTICVVIVVAKDCITE